MSRQHSPLLVRLVLIVALLFTLGCSRAYYRRQADADAYALVRQKANNPAWPLENYTIAVDPRSRMHDPFCLDAPPLPPDDPTAHELMHCVDNRRGYPGWHDNGDTAFVENPAWASYIQFDSDGVLHLGADDAVRLGILHSRNYQQELEDLYLSALDVSFERFRFDAQYFGGYSLFYTADGYQRRGAGNNSSSTLDASLFSNGVRPLYVQKAFTNGATAVVGVANSLVWQFSGPDQHTANTLVDFTLIQPLLRNAGRDRVMERLTRSERILLANVRAMEQYRQGFYLNIMTGRDAGQAPQRNGGVFGSGLEGFTGVGGGGFGRVQTAATGGGGQQGGQGAGAGAVGGYLGLLQTKQTIRNQEDNIERLRNNLFRLQQVLEELRNRSGEPDLVANILRQDLQVAQARQALVNSESRLINSRNDYQTTLDNFKITLGLPPHLCINVEDNLLDAFQLIDRRTSDEFNSLDDLIAAIGEVRLKISQQIKSKQEIDPDNPASSKVVRILPWYDELPADLADLKTRLEPLKEVRERLLEVHVPITREAIDKFAAVIDKRKAQINQLKDLITETGVEPCALLPLANFNRELLNADRLDDSLRDLKRKLAELERKFDVGYAESLTGRERQIDEIRKGGEVLPPDELFRRIYEGVLYPKQTLTTENEQPTVDVITELPADMLALQLLQARARTESVELPPVDLRYQKAIEVARRYRHDWMNARSALVDSWRLIRFNADQLQSGLNIVFSGDIQNLGDNPVKLRDSTGRLRAGVQFDAPLTRLSERNTYRQSLIEYQQARRNYYAFEDGISRSLRSDLRTITTNQINFELQRLAMLEAARQVDRNEDIRVDQELSNQASGVTAARDAVSALSDLLDAQNNFMSIFTNYEALRRALDYDLGTLQLTNEGLWVDPDKIGPDYGQTDPWDWSDDEDCLLPLPEGTPTAHEALPPAKTKAKQTANQLISQAQLDLIGDEPQVKRK